jgi:streptogramin lyase
MRSHPTPTLALLAALLPAACGGEPDPESATQVQAAVTSDVQVFQLAGGAQPEQITRGRNGEMWFTLINVGQIGRINMAGEMTIYALPNRSCRPLGITAGVDGNIWFTEEIGNKIGRLTPDGQLNEFNISTPNSFPNIIVGTTAGPLWFTQGNGAISRISTAGIITQVIPPKANRLPQGIAVAPDGNLWITESGVNKIAKLTPAGLLTEYPIPTPASGAYSIGCDSSACYFTEQSAHKVGRITSSGQITEASPEGAIAGLNNITVGGGVHWFSEAHSLSWMKGDFQSGGSLALPPGEYLPHGLALDGARNIWYAGYNTSTIVRMRVPLF